MGFTASAPPVGRLAETGAALQLGDAGGVFALELGEAGGVEGFLLGALGAGLFDGFVGEDAGGEEDGGHCWCEGMRNGSCLYMTRWRRWWREL